MDMRFDMWNVGSLYRSGSLMTVLKALPEYKLDLVEYRRSDGTEVASNQQVIIHFSVERGMRIMN
jgi:hypothetical protein